MDEFWKGMNFRVPSTQIIFGFWDFMRGWLFTFVFVVNQEIPQSLFPSKHGFCPDVLGLHPLLKFWCPNFSFPLLNPLKMQGNSFVNWFLGFRHDSHGGSTWRRSLFHEFCHLDRHHREKEKGRDSKGHNSSEQGENPKTPATPLLGFPIKS